MGSLKWYADKDTELFGRTGIRLSSVIDVWETALMGRCIIDILALDQRLHRIHGDYEERGMSMCDLIIGKYGVETNDFINSLLP